MAYNFVVESNPRGDNWSSCRKRLNRFEGCLALGPFAGIQGIMVISDI
jgi:hypothetical protein